MSAGTLEMLPVEPYFDLELFLTSSQESRIGGDTMERIADAWDRWLPHAHAGKLLVEDKQYLLVWLGDEVENEVDGLWDTSPSEAFRYNALAQVMCMGLVHAVLPQVEEAGCAPSPKVTPALEESLKAVGVPYATPGEPGLARRYAVVTYLPFSGSCEICSLVKSCPKGTGCASEPSSVELPGFRSSL